MPSKLFQCDFCDSQQRKYDLPLHIKTKHLKDLAKYLVEDAKASSVSVISAYMRKANPLSMPIPSRLHSDTDYWFGVRPIMIEEKDNVSPYMAVDANREAHASFIRELMDNISINDFMEIQRNVIIRSQEMMVMKDRVATVERMLRDMTQTHQREQDAMTTELEAYRKTVEEINDGVLNTTLRIQIEKAERAQKIAESQATKALEQVSVLEWKYRDLEHRYEESHQSITETNSRRSIEMEEAYIKRIEALQVALHKERDRTSAIKKSTKDSDKKKAERERLKKEMKEAKKRIKALEVSDSDADSD